MSTELSPAERFARAKQRGRTPELDLFRRDQRFDLDDFQQAACTALEHGRSVLVAAPTGAGKTIVAEFGRIAAEPVEADELEKARNFAKGRLVLSLEDPKGMIMFGLRSEVLEGTTREPDEVIAGLEAVTLEDIQRVAQDLIRDEGLNFALIGPFDDPDRFEKLLSLSA